MRKKLVLTAALLTACGVSRADTINVYNLSANASSGTVSGTLTLDATTGKFTASSISFLYTGVTVPGSGLVNGTAYNFSGAGTNTQTGTGYSSNDFAGTGSASLFDFDLTLPTTSLIGYAGGSLCSTSQLCSGQASAIELMSTGVDYNRVTSGTLTLTSTTAPVIPAAVSPEPSGLMLLGTGVLGMGVLLRKRYV